MRISEEQKALLKQEFKTINDNSQVYLFGSRVDDSQKGGDIDILVITPRKLKMLDLSKVRIRFQATFGYQKLDLVNFTEDWTDPFKELIIKDAIRL